MGNRTHYLISPEFVNPDGSRHQDPLYLYDDRERAWGAILHVLKTYSDTKYARFAPVAIHIYHFELNSGDKWHVFLCWNEAIECALKDQNPLP